MKVAQYHDLSYNPVALWNFNGNINDISTNSLDLFVDIGNERYCELIPGISGFYFDGATRLIRNTPTELQITGDLTFECLAILPPQIGNATIGMTWASGESDPTNINYQFQLTATPGLNLIHEYGPGSNETNSTNNVINTSSLIHLAIRRNTTDLIYEVFVNATLLSIVSYSNNSTGGSSTSFSLGGALFGGELMIGAMSSVKILDVALTNNQIKNEYNRTLGNVYGIL